MHFFPTLEFNCVKTERSNFLRLRHFDRHTHFELILKISSPCLIIAHCAGISLKPVPTQKSQSRDTLFWEKLIRVWRFIVNILALKADLVGGWHYFLNRKVLIKTTAWFRARMEIMLPAPPYYTCPAGSADFIHKVFVIHAIKLEKGFCGFRRISVFYYVVLGVQSTNFWTMRVFQQKVWIEQTSAIFYFDKANYLIHLHFNSPSPCWIIL